MTIPNSTGKTKPNARVHVNAAVRVEAVPIAPLLPEAERFPEGTRLYHAHYDAVVEVLKDGGGAYVYVKYVGTDCQQYAPRGALALRAKVRKNAAGANIAQPEAKIKRTIKKTPEEALAAELLAEYMQEKVTDRESVDKVARRNKVEVPPADKPFGLAKMQLMNSLRRMVKAGGKLK